jgi:hypothetical protein
VVEPISTSSKKLASHFYTMPHECMDLLILLVVVRGEGGGLYFLYNPISGVFTFMLSIQLTITAVGLPL